MTIIKSGEKFHCIEDYIGETGDTLFTKDKVYECKIDGSLVDNLNDDIFFGNRAWNFSFMQEFKDHFINIKDTI